MFPRQPYWHRHDFPHFSLLSFLEVSKLILFWPFVKIAKSKMLDLQEVLILQHLPTRYNRAKEGGRTFSVTTSRCWNHLPIKLRSSQSVDMFNNDALYKHFKLSQLRDKSYTPFLDNLFLDRMI